MEPLSPNMDASSITIASSFDVNAHNIIPLRDILSTKENIAAAAAQFKQEFEKKGWAIVRFTDHDGDFRVTDHDGDFRVGERRAAQNYTIIKTRNKLLQALLEFFKAPKEMKEAYTESSTLGYSSIEHKEGLHLLTGRYAAANPKQLPDELHIRPVLSEVIEQFDDLALQLMSAMAKPVFECPGNIAQATLAHRADVPVAYVHRSRGEHVGMLDVAHYFNNKTVSTTPPVGFSTEEVNCVPHFDPGLLSVSFLSTQEGLQLFDPVLQKWFAGPVNTREGEEDLGVIWLGDAAVRASGGKLKAGIHRVTFPTTDQSSRITAWYEICTVDQANQDLDPQPITGKVIELPNLPLSKPLKMDGKEDAVHKITRNYGIPRSKVMRKADFFAAGLSDDYRREKEALRQQNASNSANTGNSK